MADNAEPSGDTQLTFKVKTSSDSTHNITIAESATVLDLKTKLSGADFENISVDRQRLIYSGRVMKNDDALSTYKIKPNNTVHMVKSAASNPSQPAASSASSAAAPQGVPSNMASGTANNPLAGLTGARYAGHQINLPGMDMFGPDGGMGPPMDDARMQQMLSDPNLQQSMNEALNNPDFVNMLIESNPMLRNVPNAREMITSPFMRQMMTNPQMMSQAMRMQRNMMGGESAFPAPGPTDTTPEGAATNQTESTPAAGGQGTAQGGQNAPPNPFAALFPGGGGGGGGQGGGQGGAGADPLGLGLGGQLPPPNMEMMQQMMQMFRGGSDGSAPGAAAAAPPDNRPPEERYAEQLRQLNDMGFYDFDRNVAALRRSGGSVQGAIEHLLSS